MEIRRNVTLWGKSDFGSYRSNTINMYTSHEANIDHFTNTTHCTKMRQNFTQSYMLVIPETFFMYVGAYHCKKTHALRAQKLKTRCYFMLEAAAVCAEPRPMSKLLPVLTEAR
jgi:hypothetical protein